MKVLIIKTSALGDVVHALPVLAWLRSVDPLMEVDWLVEEGFAPILEGHPLLRRVICLQTKAWRRAGRFAGFAGAWKMLRELRKAEYDVALDLQGNSKSGLFTWLCGAPLRYGFASADVREWPNLIATNRKVALGESDFHITDRALAICRSAFPAGTDIRSAGPLPVDETALARIRSTLQEIGLLTRPVVALHYGTTWATKLWALDSWQELARRLVHEHGLQPILTWGSAAEHVAVTAIDAYCGNRCLIWPRGSLSELVALLSHVDLVVGGDTGPIHIAAAVGTATVSIFRVTDASRNAPRGERHRSLQSRLECSPCLKKSCDRDVPCSTSIAVEDVYQAVMASLSRKEHA